MANRISNRGALTQYAGSWVSPPQPAVIPRPIVYTPITTLEAQPASIATINVRTETAVAFVGQFPDPA